MSPCWAPLAPVGRLRFHEHPWAPGELHSTMHPTQEFIRCIAVGAVAIATDLGLYAVLGRVLPYSLSKGISFTCAAAMAYMLNKYWVFQRRQRSSTEVVQYLIFSVLVLGVNVLTNRAMLSLWPGKMLAAVWIATTVTGTVSYIGLKWWVFRAR